MAGNRSVADTPSASAPMSPPGQSRPGGEPPAIAERLDHALACPRPSRMAGATVAALSPRRRLTSVDRLGDEMDPLDYGTLYQTLTRTAARWGSQTAYGVPPMAGRPYLPQGVEY